MPLEHGALVTVDLPKLHRSVSGVFNRPLNNEQCEILLDSGASLITYQRYVHRIEPARGAPLLGFVLAALSGACMMGLAWWMWG